jgi:radical SAM superfamily enzyme YgiQ (UPF0313 family)
MRFLLVNPFYPVSEGPSPPLGIAFLAAVLERAGIEVRVLDLVVFPYSKTILRSVLDDFQPQFVGSTAVTMSFHHAIQVIQDVKEIDPEIITVMGGPHVTFCAEETMTSFPELDVIVVGEGEDTIVQLAEAVDSGRSWDMIKGVVYRNGSGLKRTAENKPAIDVDTLPIPARHLLPLGRYRALNTAINMTTSRGCPFKCIFCVGRKMVGAKVRYRNTKLVVDEMEQLSKLGFLQINIADDLFTANKEHCIEICDEIINRNLKIKWSSFARVDTVSPEVLSRMKEAGCTAISFGIETGNAEILKTIRKGITLEQIREAVKMCNDSGIQPCGSFILGLPGETPETLQETIAFGASLKEMNLAYGFHLLAPFPGTRVREEAAGYGLKILTNDWSEYHANRAIVETSSVNKDMLDNIAKEWDMNIEKWLGHIQKQIEAGEASEEEAFPLVNLERALLIYNLMMQDTLAQYGSWEQENAAAVSAEDALNMLVQRIPDSIKDPRERIFTTLRTEMEKENLRYRNRNGRIEWGWVDYL